jgi:hypothetical protein
MEGLGGGFSEVLEVVGVQVCGSPKVDQERSEGERRK